MTETLPSPQELPKAKWFQAKRTQKELNLKASIYRTIPLAPVYRLQPQTPDSTYQMLSIVQENAATQDTTNATLIQKGLKLQIIQVRKVERLIDLIARE